MSNCDLLGANPSSALPAHGESTSLVKVLRKTADMIDGLDATSKKSVFTPRGASNLHVVRDMYKQLCTVLHEEKMLEKTSILEASPEKTWRGARSTGTSTREHSQSVCDGVTRHQNIIQANRAYQVVTTPLSQGSSPTTYMSPSPQKVLPSSYSAHMGQSSTQHSANYIGSMSETTASASNSTNQAAQPAIGEGSVLSQNDLQKTARPFQVKKQVLGHFSGPGIKRTASRELKENFDFQRSRMGHNIPKSVELAIWYILLKNPALSFTDLNVQWLGGLVSANLVCVDRAMLVAKYGPTLPTWSTESICGHILSFKSEESGVSELFRQWDPKFKGPRTAATDEQKKQYSAWIRGRAEASRWLATQSASRGVGSIARHQAEKRALEGAQQNPLLGAQANKKLRQEVNEDGNPCQETRKAINHEAAQTMMAHHVPENHGTILQARDAYQEADLRRSEENERRIQATKLKIKELEERAAEKAHEKCPKAERSMEAQAAPEPSHVVAKRRYASMLALKESHKTPRSRASEAARAKALEELVGQQTSTAPGPRSAFHHSIQSAQRGIRPQEGASSSGPHKFISFAPQPGPARPKEPSVIGDRKLELLRAKIQQRIFERKEADKRAAEARVQAQKFKEESKAKDAASRGGLQDSTARDKEPIPKTGEQSRKAQKERDAIFKAEKECEAHLRAQQLVAELRTNETSIDIKLRKNSEVTKSSLKEKITPRAIVEAEVQSHAANLGVNRIGAGTTVRQAKSEVYPPFRREHKHSQPNLWDGEYKVKAQTHREDRRTQYQRATWAQADQELSSQFQKLQLAKRNDHTTTKGTSPPTAAHKQGGAIYQMAMNVASNRDKAREKSQLTTQAETKVFVDVRSEDAAEAMRRNRIKAEVQHTKLAPTPPPPRRGGIAAQIGKTAQNLEDTSPKQPRHGARFCRGDASPPMSSDNDRNKPNLEERKKAESTGLIEARKAEVIPSESGASAAEKKVDEEAELQQAGLSTQRNASTTLDESLQPVARSDMKPEQPSGRTEAQEVEPLQGNPLSSNAGPDECVPRRIIRKLRRAREVEHQASLGDHATICPDILNHWVDDQQKRLEKGGRAEGEGSEPQLFASQPRPPLPMWIGQASQTHAMREQWRLVEARRDEGRNQKAGHFMFEHPKVGSLNIEPSQGILKEKTNDEEFGEKPKVEESEKETSKKGELQGETSKKVPEESLKKNKGPVLKPEALQEVCLPGSAEEKDDVGEWEMLEKPEEASRVAKTPFHAPNSEGRQERKSNYLFRLAYRKNNVWLGG